MPHGEQKIRCSLPKTQLPNKARKERVTSEEVTPFTMVFIGLELGFGKLHGMDTVEAGCTK